MYDICWKQKSVFTSVQSQTYDVTLMQYVMPVKVSMMARMMVAMMRMMVSTPMPSSLSPPVFCPGYENPFSWSNISDKLARPRVISS